jgi:hypothetical protein
MALDHYRRRRITKTIRELMKRGTDDPRVVPIPVPDTTPGAPDPKRRGSFGIEASSSSSFVGRSRVSASTTISGSSTASFTNISQGYVADFPAVPTSVRFTSRARKVSTLSTSGTASASFTSTSTSPVSRLLMESGSYVLQETDDRIILETTSQNAVLMESGSYVLREDNGRVTLENVAPPPEEPPPGSAILDVSGNPILDVSGNTILGV